jgi:hypothetical protein
LTVTLHALSQARTAVTRMLSNERHDNTHRQCAAAVYSRPQLDIEHLPPARGAPGPARTTFEVRSPPTRSPRLHPCTIHMRLLSFAGWHHWEEGRRASKASVLLLAPVRMPGRLAARPGRAQLARAAHHRRQASLVSSTRRCSRRRRGSAPSAARVAPGERTRRLRG